MSQYRGRLTSRCEYLMPMVRGVAGRMYTWLSASGERHGKRAAFR
jgi:hypothetical protein